MKDIKNIKTPIISPSLLAANRLDLANETLKVASFGAEFIHIDVMDGKFVSNTSFSLDEIKEITAKSPIINDVHLMIEKPLEHIEEYAKAGASLITFHFEACSSLDEIKECISKIHSFSCFAGLSIKPNTPVEVLKPFINDLDLILLMSVEPGKGGQKFIPSSLDRLKEINVLLSSLPKEKRPLIEIDGGINNETGKASLQAGANVLVAGSYLFGHEDMKERIEDLLCA